jgi:hypothetical protein
MYRTPRAKKVRRIGRELAIIEPPSRPSREAIRPLSNTASTSSAVVARPKTSG